MSLIDELRDIGAALPPSHIPGLAEALPILGALVASAEHDVEKLLDAVKADLDAAKRGDQPSALNDVLAPPSEEVSDAPLAAPVASASAGNAVGPAPATTVPVQTPSDQAELVQVRDERDELARQVAELSQQVQNLVADRDRTAATVEPTGDPTRAPIEPGPSNPEGLS